MAWTEQCKVAFRANAQTKLLKEKPTRDGRRPVTKVLKSLSKECDIPFKTLERWYYEKDPNLKNEAGKSIQNNKQKTLPPETLCKECNKNKLYIDNKSGKPLSSRSLHYGLCGTCRAKEQEARAKKRRIKCPKCGHKFKPKGKP